MSSNGSRTSRKSAGSPRIGLGWGLIDQGFSSATNLGLSILAGRFLGPGGLGRVFLGFAAYLLVLEFQTALLQEPLAVTFNRSDEESIRSAFTIGLCYQVTATALMLALGSVIPGDFGRALLLIAPWMIPLLFQDLCRTIAFRQRRGRLAAGLDGIWALGMAISLPLIWTHRTDAAVVAVWGFGALLGALLGFGAIRLRPQGVRRALTWWKADMAPLGRWLGLESAALVIDTQGAIFLIAALVGAGKLGGLRAVQSAFAPMTLIGPAMRMPGLPAMARALGHPSPRRGRRRAQMVARRLSAAALSLVVVYFIVLVAAGGHVLSIMFGHAFVPFRSLIVPVGLGQVTGAAALGYYILLKAAGRGRAVFLARVVAAVATFPLIGILAAGGSVYGAAWGASLGAALGWVVVAVAARRLVLPPKMDAKPPARPAPSDALGSVVTRAQLRPADAAGTVSPFFGQEL